MEAILYRCDYHQRKFEQKQLREQQVEALERIDKIEERLRRLDESMKKILVSLEKLQSIERLVEALQPNDQVNPDILQPLVDDLQE